MKKGYAATIFVIVFFSIFGCAGSLSTLNQSVGGIFSQSPDTSTIISGLKEALSIGTENAVTSVSQSNGYYSNDMIKILMPKKIQKVADVVSKLGYQQQVDEFILSMNRAAEKAAPKATAIFVDSIKEMTFDDAKGILNGGNTAATDYFKSKTSDKIYAAFKPIISSSLDKVGATRSFKALIDKYTTLPFMKIPTFDLDHYVTDKALDGLFYTIGQEEKKIREDPAARATKLLKKVFEK